MKRIITLSLFLIFATSMYAQTPTSGDLVRIHNVTTTEMNSITNVDTGSLIYNLDSLCLYQYDGTNWEPMREFKISSVKVENDSLKIIESNKTFAVELSSTNSTPEVLSISSGTATWDADSSFNAELTLTQATTALSLNNFKAGCYGTITVIQDATGGRGITLPTGSKVMNSGNGSISLSDQANAIDILSFYYDGTSYYWNYALDYD